MNPYEYKLTIRLQHRDLDLTKIQGEIEDLLVGIKFGNLVTAGKERISKAGKQLGSHYEKSFLSFAFSEEKHNSQDQSLEDFIKETLTKLTPCQKLFSDFVKSDGSVIFFIGIFLQENSGIIFNPELIHELQKAHIEIQLDIYPR